MRARGERPTRPGARRHAVAERPLPQRSAARPRLAHTRTPADERRAGTLAIPRRASSGDRRNTFHTYGMYYFWPMATASESRRTQHERRQATQNALLEATIQCLVEQGYAGTTTRAVSARAGVSPGALQHHFTSKQELVAEAIGYLNGKLTARLIEHGVPSG